MSNDHSRFMQAALSLAQRNLGQTWPNPSVGAVLVKNGLILGQGYTQRGGRPHAETEAIAQAGDNAKGATLYVTLEPCNHHGQTSPCTEAIMRAGISKVIVACKDPHKDAAGGMAKLQSAGIEVVSGVCEKDARELNRGFFSVVEKQRPYIALKIASSQDGKISGGKDRWITSEPSRSYGHILRSRYDAIATGIGTVLADDPLLTCRLPGLEDRSPVRIVFDRNNRLPQDSKLVQTSNEVPLWVMKNNLKDAIAELTQKGVTRLLVEAGQKLSDAFIQSGMVDRIYWFRAPVVIGDAGLAALSAPLPTNMNVKQNFRLGPDTLDIFECSPASSAA